MTKIAITGSCGFVGKRLVNRLKNQKDDIEVIEIDIDMGFDILDQDSLSKIGHFDVLIHLAAKSFVPESYENPHEYFTTNVLGTLNVLELCRKYKSRMVFVSSYLYGNPKSLPIKECHERLASNPYGMSKLMGENLCESYHRDMDVPIIIVRPFNIYGPGQNPNFLIPTMIAQALNGRLELRDPRPKRDFIYIDDLIDALCLILNYKNTSFDVFNIGSGISSSIQEIVDIIEETVENEIEVKYLNQYRPNEIMDTKADISKIVERLGWQPKITLKEGVRKILNET
jgi:nucleoside-diphosphate-sugar epimerase